MAVLKDILYKISLQSTSGDMAQPVTGLSIDSRRVEEGHLFAAIRGTQMDGHDYVDAAIEKGAKAIICQTMPDNTIEGISYILVQDSAAAVAVAAANFYENPSQKLKLVAITGTNGKTTCATLAYQLFRDLGYNTGLLSTIRICINDEQLPATHTTPDAIQLQKTLAEMVKKGCTHCFMEASSHALVQKRMHGLDIDIAVFTNITHDHLDYHGTFDEYIKAKKILFDGLKKDAKALINSDDKRSEVMVQNTKATVLTFGVKNMSDFKARIMSNTIQGLELDIDHHNVWFPMVGAFNAYNLLAVYAIAELLGEPQQEALESLSKLRSVEGRFETIISEDGITGIVDYAHTPDALDNVLDTIKNFRTGNETLFTVIGCGGNRDKTKRPEMAKIACKYSDKIIFTSDNPRNEEPDSIIEDMLKGVGPSDFRKTLKQTDRREAIKMACTSAKPGDIILIAGKGHETYQEIKGVRHHFDDREELKKMFQMLKGS